MIRNILMTVTLIALLAPPVGVPMYIEVANISKTAVPPVHTNLFYEDGTLIYVDTLGNRIPVRTTPTKYRLGQLRFNPSGTDSGLQFDFSNPDFNGKVYYGFLPDSDEVKYTYPVFGDRSMIAEGQAEINLVKDMSGIFDIINWQKTGRVRLGYRIVNDRGQMLYDGKIMLAGTGPFTIDTSIIEGPFINLVTHTGAVVSFETNFETRARVIVDGRSFVDDQPGTHHEIRLDGLQPATEHAYTVVYGKHKDSYSFRTAPAPGSRQPFTFAYASDARGNYGGGERDIWGVNAYIMKRIMVLCALEDVSFLQFTGDMIDGYTSDEGEIMLEYANWKRAIEPYAHYFPVIAGFGNHEWLTHEFRVGKKKHRLDKFPFATHSGEAVFARNFVNPTNGPASEDGAAYDPDPESIDFPPYAETVFYYTYDNIAMVVLNANYWFASSRNLRQTGGNPHGYVMDNQLAWLKSTLATLEADDNLDHVFVTVHTPIFPNGGHVDDDMWYDGKNDRRPVVAGEPVAQGIIERRDEILDLLMNHSTKVAAILTGDEHNYSLLRLTAGMPIYLDDYPHQRLTKIRPLWQINNGAAGAPYYGREQTPWYDHVQTFTTQNALVLFQVHGKSVLVEVINPDTMEPIDQFQL